MAPTNDKSASKKPKLVRDSFTIPKNEFAAIEALKARAIALGTSVKKSELLRAGLMALQGLSDAAYKAAVAAVPTLKTGRPAAKAPAAQPVATPAKKKAAVKKPAARKAAPTKAAKPAAKAATKAAPKAPNAPAAKPTRKAPAKKAAAGKATAKAA
jgi:hypothetical protein